jgi:hypothetical protein
MHLVNAYHNHFKQTRPIQYVVLFVYEAIILLVIQPAPGRLKLFKSLIQGLFSN